MGFRIRYKVTEDKIDVDGAYVRHFGIFDTDTATTAEAAQKECKEYCAKKYKLKTLVKDKDKPNDYSEVIPL